MKWNKLLNRQFRKNRVDPEQLSPELIKVLNAVSESYDHYDQDRTLITRAMELSSKEMREMYEKLAIQSELKRANTELQQFVSIASHDLKSPLRTINSFGQLLNRSLKDLHTKETEEYLNFILSSIATMRNLLDDLTTYTKLENQSLNPEHVDLNKIIAIVIRNLTFDIEKSNAQVTVEGDFPSITACPSKVMQLFQNIIANAIKFRGDKPPEIHISLVENKEGIIISISDNGIGIDPAYQDKIFNAFTRLKEVKEIEGTGLGLSICKKIVEALDGKIWLSSKKDEGTTFYFSIPNGKIITTTPQKKESILSPQ